MSSPHPLRLVQFGLGPIGLGAARVVLTKGPALHLVGAIDVDSEKAGRDLAELLDLPEETGVVGERTALTLDLKMNVGAENARDAVQVDGDPPIDLLVHGGIFGDTATCALLVNMAPLVMEVKPGLRTMAGMPVPRAFGTALAG